MLRPGWTTIPVSRETRQQLKDMGRKGESYDSVILRLIALYRKVHTPSVTGGIL
jgi:predicted CopG family antitoxin